MLSILRKKEKPLTADVAGQMLQNVFDVCEVEPNSVSLNDLQSYSNYRKDRFVLHKVILIVVMLLFLALPIMFIGPNIQLLEQTTQSPNTTYTLAVDSLLPILSVKATVNGKNIPVYEKEKMLYSIEPDISGEMTITVTSINHQYCATRVDVSSIDRKVPVVLKEDVRNGLIYIYLEDKDSGINYKKIYAQNSDGETFKPDKHNADKGWIAFSYPKSSINIFIPDNAENILQLALTIK